MWLLLLRGGRAHRLACLTSLTPPEQATRLSDKVVSANPSWFRAPRKIDTYFSSPVLTEVGHHKPLLIFFFSSPFSLRFKAVGHRDHWAGFLNVSGHKATVYKVWNSIWLSGDRNLRSLAELGKKNEWMTDACRGFYWVPWTIFIFTKLKWVFGGPLWPPLSNLSPSIHIWRNTNSYKIGFVLHCHYLHVSKGVYELHCQSGSKAVTSLTWLTGAL